MRVAVLDDYQQVAHGYADWSGLDVTSFAEPRADLESFEVIVAMRERTRFPAGGGSA